MSKGQRFCINCGRALGDLPWCDNPDCQNLPNFYRHVPGPERVGSHTVGGGLPPGPPGEDAPSAPRRQESTLVEGPIPERTTLTLAHPVAWLRSIAPPIVEHVLHAGVNEVGARPPAKIIVDRPEVSSRHARIECREDPAGRWQITITDLGSRNGTYVNGEKSKSRGLAGGDKVRFATVEYELRLIETEKPRMTISI